MSTTATAHTAGPQFDAPGLALSFQVRLGAMVGRAFDRLTEAQVEQWQWRHAVHTAAGYVDDVASVMALDDVYGAVQWRRFRK